MGPIRRLILWDIDGTLISAGPFTRRAFDLAVASAVGREPGDHGVSFGGKTDPEIAMEILAALAVLGDDARGRLPAVIQALEREMGAAEDVLRTEGSVLPGVREVLEQLHDTPGVLQSVLTGNVEANARLKVGAFGLDAYLDLDVGAYGSDGEDRTTFVPLAVR
jgi:phosphoglycolate phosphatase